MHVDPSAAQASTVKVRVQVIDVEPRTLDLTLPAYLPAKDLTQRVARDAGLPDYWPDGHRREYWLRARGRVLLPDENLQDLGVVRAELLHLLPVPLDMSEVLERYPEYPETRGYSAKGWPALLTSAAVLLLWIAGWGLALSASRSWGVTTLPGFGLGLFSVSLARHIFGGEGWRSRVAAVGLGIGVAALIPALGLAFALGAELSVLQVQGAVGLGFVLAGVLFGWLAWWGAVEPLEKLPEPVKVVDAKEVVHTCGICGGQVDHSVLLSCQYRCGRVFHTGCYNARMAVYRGDPGNCGICGTPVA
ncbi:MAG: EsaB/YukD family protein [Myxococcota bacterium]|nr:EsaB/YukD family protein [Myxococcota bacterium]